MKRIPKLVCALIFSVGIAPFAHAQFTWSPSAASGTFETGSNWTGGTAPTPGSSLVFSSATGITAVSLSSAFSASSLTFTNFTYYELLTSNGSVLSIGSGGVTVANNDIDLRGPIALTANQTWNTAGQLFYNTTNAISGNFGITKTGSSNLILNAPNTFTGGVAVSAGNIYLDSSSTGSAGAVTSGPVGTGTLSFTADGLALRSNNSVVIHNAIDLGNHTVGIDSGSNNLTLAGVISGDGGSLEMSSTGNLTLSGASTFNGGLTIYSSASTLTLGSSSTGSTGAIISGPFGTGPLTFFGSSTLTITAGTNLTIHNAITPYNEPAGDFNIPAASSLTLTGVLDGYVNKTGPGNLILVGANKGANIIAGTLTLGDGDIIVDESNISVAAGATFDLAGFSETINRLSGAGNVTLGTGTLTLYGEGSTTFSGIIAGAGNLVNSGSSNLTLSGINTYTGTTTISGGTLAISADANLGTAPVSATPGSLVFDSGYLNTTASFTLSANRGITVTGYGGTIETDLSTTLTYGGIVIGSGYLDKEGGGTLVLSGASTFSDGLTVYEGSLLLGASSTQTSYYDSEFQKTIYSVVSGPVGTGTLSLYADTTLGVAVGAGPITLHNDIEFTDYYDPIVDTTNGNITLLGTISGEGSLTKTGPGTLTLSGANIFTGGATVSTGTLLLGSSSVVTYQEDPWYISSGPFGTGSLTLETGTTLAPVAGSGTTTPITIYNPIILSGDATIGTLGSSDQLRFDTKSGLASGIRGDGPGRTLTVAGGLLTLAADPTAGYVSGESYNLNTITVNSGAAVVFAFESALPSNAVNVAVGGYVGVADGVLNLVPQGFLSTASDLIAKLSPSAFAGTFGFDSESTLSPATYTGTLDFSSFSNANFDGLSTLDYAIIGTGATLFAPSSGPNSGKLAFSALNGGTLQVDAALLTAHNFNGILIGREDGRADTGSVVLSNATNNYTGGTSLKSGTLVVRDAAALGTGTLTASNSPTAPSSSANAPKLTTTLSGNNALNLTLANALVVNTSYASGAYGLGIGGIDDFTLSGAITGSGVIDKYGTGTVTLTGDATAFTGSINIGDGTLIIGNGGTTGAITGNVVNNATLAFNRSNTSTYTGVISGTGSLSKQGTGTLSLNAQNTYTGSTYLSGGTLTIGVVNALPVTTQLALSSNSVLDVLNNQTIAGFLTTDTTTSLLLGAGATFTVAMPDADQTTTFAGNVSGAGIFAVSGAGNDVVNLTGAVTNTGGTVVGLGASLVIGSGGSVTGPITTTGTLGFGNSGTQTLSNVISGTGGISVTAGTTILSGNNTYSGPTDINGGKLVLTGINTGGGTITVGSGGTFGGTGSTTGPLVLNSGATVSPGASPGTLSVGATTFAGGANLAFESNNATGTAGTNWDLLSISGALTITATVGNPFVLNLTSFDSGNNAGLLANFNSANTYSWQFVTTTTGVTGFSAGAFQYNASAFQNSLGDGHFFVSNVGNDLFLNFTPVPEPSTYALLALGLGVVVALSRRRRRL